MKIETALGQLDCLRRVLEDLQRVAQEANVLSVYFSDSKSPYVQLWEGRRAVTALAELYGEPTVEETGEDFFRTLSTFGLDGIEVFDVELPQKEDEG